MDMSRYAGQVFIKPDDVRGAPVRERIVRLSMGKYDRPVANFESGDALTLNQTNIRALIRAYGRDGRAWIGHDVELYVGEIEYDGRQQESVLVRPISKAGEASAVVLPPEEPSTEDVLDNSIPF